LKSWTRDMYHTPLSKVLGQNQKGGRDPPPTSQSILDKNSPIGTGLKYDDINTILSVVIKILSYVGNPVYFVR